jgi:hypothetical protein
MSAACRRLATNSLKRRFSIAPSPYPAPFAVQNLAAKYLVRVFSRLPSNFWLQLVDV